MEDWTSLGQHKRHPEFPVVTRESRRNSRKTTWFPRHRKMKPFPATAFQEKCHVRNWRPKRSLAHLMRPQKFPRHPGLPGEEHRGFPAPLPLSPFYPPDLDRRVDSPALSGRGSRLSGRTSGDRKSTRLNSSHHSISYAVFCLKKKKKQTSIESRKQQGMVKERTTKSNKRG